MLVSLADMKTYLGVSGTTYDDFLTQQIKLISEAIEMYCNRSFSLKSFKQTFYKEQLMDCGIYKPQVMLYHFPINTLIEVKKVTSSGEELVDLSTLRVHKPSSIIDARDESKYFTYRCDLEVKYSAGFSDSNMPEVVKNVVYSLVGERYNKKLNGIDLGFGSDVQSISVPGVINIAYDYTLESNSKDSPFGIILGNYTNSLDYLKSERTILGSGELYYLEDII